MARGGARPGAGRPARKSANTSPPSPRARARARGGSENQRPWPADKVERWSIDRLIPSEFARTGFRGGLNWYRNIDRSPLSSEKPSATQAADQMTRIYITHCSAKERSRR
jgi:hypothetical protein